MLTHVLKHFGRTNPDYGDSEVETWEQDYEVLRDGAR
ncbi:hypothetical protein EV378_3046 [Pseudonocardia endophytica]|uniref:Uncharacterized protein n=1 Tax=Pseudonocardia endophytica TaxID=401976 RepID=A0A4R1IA34_PSEEN|nr:hypothetical protein EV378_3046 [Pseudonocardia endophytica]